MATTSTLSPTLATARKTPNTKEKEEEDPFQVVKPQETTNISSFLQKNGSQHSNQTSNTGLSSSTEEQSKRKRQQQLKTGSLQETQEEEEWSENFQWGSTNNNNNNDGKGSLSLDTTSVHSTRSGSSAASITILTSPRQKCKVRANASRLKASVRNGLNLSLHRSNRSHTSSDNDRDDDTMSVPSVRSAEWAPSSRSSQNKTNTTKKVKCLHLSLHSPTMLIRSPLPLNNPRLHNSFHAALELDPFANDSPFKSPGDPFGSRAFSNSNLPVPPPFDEDEDDSFGNPSDDDGSAWGDMIQNKSSYRDLKDVSKTVLIDTMHDLKGSLHAKGEEIVETMTTKIQELEAKLEESAHSQSQTSQSLHTKASGTTAASAHTRSSQHMATIASINGMGTTTSTSTSGFETLKEERRLQDLERSFHAREKEIWNMVGQLDEKDQIIQDLEAQLVKNQTNLFDLREKPKRRGSMGGLKNQNMKQKRRGSTGGLKGHKKTTRSERKEHTSAKTGRRERTTAQSARRYTQSGRRNTAQSTRHTQSERRERTTVVEEDSPKPMKRRGSFGAMVARTTALSGRRHTQSERRERIIGVEEDAPKPMKRRGSFGAMVATATDLWSQTANALVLPKTGGKVRQAGSGGAVADLLLPGRKTVRSKAYQSFDQTDESEKGLLHANSHHSDAKALKTYSTHTAASNQSAPAELSSQEMFDHVKPLRRKMKKASSAGALIDAKTKRTSKTMARRNSVDLLSNTANAILSPRATPKKGKVRNKRLRLSRTPSEAPPSPLALAKTKRKSSVSSNIETKKASTTTKRNVDAVSISANESPRATTKVSARQSNLSSGQPRAASPKTRSRRFRGDRVSKTLNALLSPRETKQKGKVVNRRSGLTGVPEAPPQSPISKPKNRSASPRTRRSRILGGVKKEEKQSHLAATPSAVSGTAKALLSPHITTKAKKLNSVKDQDDTATSKRLQKKSSVKKQKPASLRSSQSNKPKLQKLGSTGALDTIKKKLQQSQGYVPDGIQELLETTGPPTTSTASSRHKRKPLKGRDKKTTTIM